MRKSDLVNQVAEATRISKIDVLVTIEHTLQCIQQSVTAGEPVYIRGFGTFTPKKRLAKMGRNIKKGSTIQIPAHYVPQFKPAKEFRLAVGKLKVTDIKNTLPEKESLS